MTAPRTPDDEPGRDQQQASTPQDAAVPPPPRWLTEADSQADAPLLPEAPPPPFDTGDNDTDGNDAETTRFDSEVTRVDRGAGQDGGDENDADATRTDVYPAKAAAASPPAPQPSPDETVTDLSPWLPSKSEAADQATDEDEDDDDLERTRVDHGPRLSKEEPTEQLPLPRQPAPGPQQEAPDEAAAAPFPYAQQIPGTPLAAPTATPQPPAPPAPEPFPYAQQIPDASSALPAPGPAPAPAPYQPPAPPSDHRQPPAPFPFPQDIPDNKPQPTPFPYAQEIPGHDPNPPGLSDTRFDMGPAPQPVAPPPQIDEPWRTAPSGKKKRGSGKLGKRIALIAGAGLAAAALVAGGFVVVSNLGGDDEGGGPGAQLARSVFPVDATARTDGYDQDITGVAASGSTVVAVGGETGPRGSRGMFLVSTDGGRTFGPAAVRGADDTAPRVGDVPAAVGGSSRGWVAIGSRVGGGAVWTSENGRDWQRQPDAVGDVFGGNTRVNRIVAAGDRFLAVGETSAKGDFSDSVPAVWLSGDGRRWEPRSGDQIGLQVRDARLQLVTAAASGDVILMEALVTPQKGRQGAYRRVWRSQDGGRTWTNSEVPVPKGSRGLIIGGGPAGFVAVRELGAGGSAHGQAFVSKDGGSWTQAGTLKTSGYRVTTQLLGDDKGFAAVVTRGRDVLLSRSADGRSWRDTGVLAAQPGREINDAALAGEQTVLVGTEPGGGDADPLLGVWDGGGRQLPVDLAKVPGAVRSDHSVIAVGATGDRAVAVGSAAGDAAVWTSQDGGTWQPAQGLGAAFTRPGSQQLLDVTSGGSGWLAVGYDQVAPRRPLVVTSADGTTWQAVDTAAAFRGSSRAVPTTSAAASGQAGYVVVGTDGTSAAAWFSADLKNWERGRDAGANAGPNGALNSRNGDTRWILDVTGGSFGYAAVGGVRDPKAGNRPGVWSSTDGKQWTLQLLSLPGGTKEGHLTHVASNGNTLVAAGIAATGQGLVWLGYVSSDGGKTWQPLQAPGGDAKVTMTSLSSAGKGFAATGTTGDPGAADVVSWTSANGSSWTSQKPGGKGLAGDGEQQVTGLAAFKGKLLGVGRTADQNDDQPILWTRPVP
ncbi:hypothetical protein [Actinomadura miaoliensis]|uniref:Exo-alpha-sialidase n=1 Tax=Actinomadura miaoliensis TaxID=430685 RepID=A0ABP7WXW4_9ACTN